MLNSAICLFFLLTSPNSGCEAIYDSLAVENSVGAAPAEGNVAEFTVYLPQGNTPRTITALNIDGVAASQLKLTGTPEANVLNTLSFKCIFVGGEWKATVAIG